MDITVGIDIVCWQISIRITYPPNQIYIRKESYHETHNVASYFFTVGWRSRHWTFLLYWFIVVIIIIYCTWIHLYKEILHMHNTRRAGWRDDVWNNNFSKSREGAQLAVIAMLLNRLLHEFSHLNLWASQEQKLGLFKFYFLSTLPLSYTLFLYLFWPRVPRTLIATTGAFSHFIHSFFYITLRWNYCICSGQVLREHVA